MENFVADKENGELSIAGDVEDDEGSNDESEYETDDNDADVEENNEDERPENENKELENNSVVSDKSKVNTSSRKKRKRKKKDNTKRRQIRKILDESQLDRETLNAQLEERERLRRLELQKSLATEGQSAHPVSTTPPCNSDSCISQSPVVVDFRKKTKQQSAVIVIDSDDDANDVSNKHNIEVISSGSDDGSDGMKSDESDTEEDSDIDENNVGLHSDDKFNVPNQNGSVLVNTDHPLSEDDIFLAPQIARCVKPHQIGGIRFLYDNLIETLARYHVSAGFGCILAHSMGLGKTLQVVAFTDIFLRYTPAKKVLIVVPINTIQNWMGEFDMWIPRKPETIDIEGSNGTVNDCSETRYRNFDVHLLGDNNKTTVARAKIIGLWNQNGGVLLMGYELYRILAMSTPCMASNKCAPPKKKKSSTNNTSNSQEPEVIDLEEEEKNMDFLIGIQKALCKPGPDLVICDEGHRIKNNQANISQALKRIKTRRRVVLTGYPLQNNLVEYWCMVDFVRPNFLGTRQEFSNMFERPILNGQCSDSTPSDVRLMRYRAHVLHSLLEGFVQRRSQAVLTKCLPTKEEHIILIKLSDIQSQLYNTYINHLLESAGHLNPIKGFHTCTKIWNHPDVFYSMLEPKKYGQRYQSPLTLQDSEVDETINNLCGVPEDSETNKSITPGQQVAESVNNTSASLSWAKDIMKDYKPLVAENGGKVVILMEIVKESLRAGEKVLVFSQSLSTLGIIEDFLSRQEIPYFPGRPGNNGSTKWARNKSYFRLDGSTPSQERDRLINAFNSPDNCDVLLFMLSTRAGCLGVNLIGASRVVVFDASWNPCHDVQAVCRVYRYGQRKQTHIYRLVSVNTMEKKIYDRQVSKQGVANRVVDELNPEANFTKQEIMSLICEKEPDIPAEDVASAAITFTDPVLNNICRNYSDWIAKLPFKHESLLVDRKELKLTKLEKKEARKGYEREKNMAQQGSRYYINPVPESSRGSSSSSSSFAGSSRPAGNSIPTAPTILPRLPQPQQAKTQNLSPYFLQNLLNQSNVRFATLNTNRAPNPLSVNQLMPNISAQLAANIIANQLQINRALSTAANPQCTSGSACRLPGLPTGLTPGQIPGVIHGHMSGSTPCLTPGLTPGLSPGLGTSLNGRPIITTSTCSLSNSTQSPNVVTIDLDDVPSPPPAKKQSAVTTATNAGSPSEPDNVPSPLPTMVSNATIATKETSETTIETKETPDVAIQTKETEAAMETNDTNNGRTLIEVVLPQQHFVTMETEQTNNLTSNIDAMVTDNAPPLGTRPALPLAVLQNLLNEQGGLGTRPLPPEESPHSPTGSSQI